MFADHELYILAVESGLDTIYCSNTGLPVAKIDEEEMIRFIELEIQANPLIENDELLDHLSLSMLAINSRPSPLFQNMTPARYKSLSTLYPEHMFRFLAGRMIFEGWNQLAGFVKYGDKVAWLREIPVEHDASPAKFMECLETMIRIDAILSLRQVYVPETLEIQINALRENWKGFDYFFSFVEALETANIRKLAKRDVSSEGRVSGNAMAVKAAIDNASQSSEEHVAGYTMRRSAEILNEARRENRATEQMRKLKRKLAAQFGNGQVQVKRGVEAFLDYADLGDTFNKEMAMRFIAMSDSAKDRARVELRMNGKQAAHKSSKPKEVKAKRTIFNLAAIDLDSL